MRLHASLGLLIASAALGTSTALAAESESLGIWTNPQRSVQVRAHRCGTAMCGTVIQASEKARADARKGGVDNLIGARLFSGFVPEKENVWRGKVFVPDIGKTFSGTITLVNERTLSAQGCLIGRIGCRSQVWTRVDN
ncbi:MULTISPECIES: DUF2147 domain-containing protein [unclassified Sphingobium]|uniref:DUF2147 domain-containing protein n=1 Tax=unclassified Sphingobium TaxID=2611147 RepID=UPI002225B63B|nr:MULTISPECIES: DUF2147 domain-containing protein [unclassified Sphingobium]MCW2412777.1 uncharacterized protein (DUF2147 family) [Sphingobium sp. B8D3D]MCW2414925.1 uncharacterized protein (DUF2147 family) [Sphingobium sp. B8D3A]